MLTQTCLEDALWNILISKLISFPALLCYSDSHLAGMLSSSAPVQHNHKAELPVQNSAGSICQKNFLVLHLLFPSLMPLELSPRDVALASSGILCYSLGGLIQQDPGIPLKYLKRFAPTLSSFFHCLALTDNRIKQ